MIFKLVVFKSLIFTENELSVSTLEQIRIEFRLESNFATVLLVIATQIMALITTYFFSWELILWHKCLRFISLGLVGQTDSLS